MAWLAAESKQKIDLEPERTWQQVVGQYLDTSGSARQIVMTAVAAKYQYQGLTKAAAATVVAAEIALGDGINATADWNGAGGYSVTVTKFQATYADAAVPVEE